MIGSATNLSAGKKLLGVLVAIAMVLTMSNIAVWTADADQNTDGAKRVVSTEDTPKNAEEVENTPAASEPVKDEPAQKEETPKAPESDSEDDSSDDVDQKVAGATQNPADDEASDATTDEGTQKDEATVYAPAPQADDPEEVVEEEGDEPIVDEEKTHSITVRVEIYENGTIINELTNEDEIVRPFTSEINFDVAKYIKTAQAGVKAGWAFDKSEPALPGGDGWLTVGPNHSSKSVTYKLYYETDEKVDPYNGQTGLEKGDGVPDKYQKTVTYHVVNGAWDASGDNADKTECVTFYGENGLSSDVNATGVLHLPNVVPTPDKDNYFSEKGSWNINANEPVVTFGGASDFYYTYEVDESIMHSIQTTINYYLDGKEYKVGVPSIHVAPIDANLTFSLAQSVFKISNPFYSTGNVVLDHVDYDFVADDSTVTLPAFSDSIDLGNIDVYYWSDTMGPDDPNKSDGVPDICQVKITIEDIVNGYLLNERERVKVYTLSSDISDPEEAATKTIEVKLPESRPDDGYIRDVNKEYGGGWSDSRVTSGDRLRISKADDGLKLINTFVPAPYAYTVYYFDDQTNLPILDAEVYSALYLEKIKATDHAININGYVFSYANIDELTVGSNPSNNGITLFYDADANEDGIADKYQVTVNYGAINGTIRGNNSEIVTLYDANGNPAINGTGKLAHIPTFIANAGFGNGKWSAEGQPTANTVITKNTNFLITYSANTSSNNSGNSNKNNNGSNGNSGNSGNTNNGGNSGNNGNAGTYNPSEPGFVPYGPGDATVAATDDPEADAVDDEETVEEEAIPEDENPLAEPEEEGVSDDQQVIADDENALSDYAETSFNWIPLAIAAGIIIIGGLIFFVARKKKNESSAR